MVDGLNKSSSAPDNLIAGDYPAELRAGVTITGGVALLRGALLGRIVAAGAVAVIIGAANTGNGVLAGQAAAAGAQIGAYKIVCIEPNANLGTFEVFDPLGVSIGRYIVGAAAFNNQITFTIADGAVDFVAGDEFTITIAAGAEKFKLAAAAAVDGSQVPCAVLAQDCDASGGDKVSDIFLTGEFNKTEITFGVGHTAASTLWDLSQKNIYLRDVVSN